MSTLKTNNKVPRWYAKKGWRKLRPAEKYRIGDRLVYHMPFGPDSTIGCTYLGCIRRRPTRPAAASRPLQARREGRGRK